MKNYIIPILVLIIIILGIYTFFKQSDSVENTVKLIEVKREKDSIQRLFNAKQAAYNLTALQLHRKEAELLISRAQVKRSEDQLAKSKEKEKIALKAEKQATQAMTKVIADSIIQTHYKDDPDSISQKLVFDLNRLAYCDSIRNKQTELLNDYSVLQSKSDSTVKLQSILLKDSRDQIDILLASQDKDKEILKIKDKQIKRLRRQNRVLKVLAPVAFVLGVALVL